MCLIAFSLSIFTWVIFIYWSDARVNQLAANRLSEDLAKQVAGLEYLASEFDKYIDDVGPGGLHKPANNIHFLGSILEEKLSSNDIDIFSQLVDEAREVISRTHHMVKWFSFKPCIWTGEELFDILMLADDVESSASFVVANADRRAVADSAAATARFRASIVSVLSCLSMIAILSRARSLQAFFSSFILSRSITDECFGDLLESLDEMAESMPPWRLQLYTLNTIALAVLFTIRQKLKTAFRRGSTHG